MDDVIQNFPPWRAVCVCVCVCVCLWPHRFIWPFEFQSEDSSCVPLTPPAPQLGVAGCSRTSICSMWSCVLTAVTSQGAEDLNWARAAVLAVSHSGNSCFPKVWTQRGLTPSFLLERGLPGWRQRRSGPEATANSILTHSSYWPVAPSSWAATILFGGKPYLGVCVCSGYLFFVEADSFMWSEL